MKMVKLIKFNVDNTYITGASDKIINVKGTSFSIIFPLFSKCSRRLPLPAYITNAVKP